MKKLEEDIKHCKPLKRERHLRWNWADETASATMLRNHGNSSKRDRHLSIASTLDSGDFEISFVAIRDFLITRIYR